MDDGPAGARDDPARRGSTLKNLEDPFLVDGGEGRLDVEQDQEAFTVCDC